MNGKMKTIYRRINSGVQYSIIISITGLQLVLYMESQEYLTGITNGYGARLVIHSPNTYPFPWDEGLYISSAMETSIGLKMVCIDLC